MPNDIIMLASHAPITKELVILALSFMVIAMFIVVVVAMWLFRPWFRAFASHAPIPLALIIIMKLRGTPTTLLVDAYIQLVHRGVKVSIGEVEHVYIANKSRVRTAGDLVDLVEARESSDGEPAA